MKTKFAIAAIALALTSASAFAETTVGDGEIYITGNVTAVSCKVTLDGAATDKDKTIKLKDVQLGVFQEAGTAYEKTPFTISITECYIPYQKTASLAWTAADVANDSGYLKNTTLPDDGGANNVDIALLDATGGSIIDLKTGDGKTAATTVDATTKAFSYQAGYVTTNPATVTTGGVTAKATYTISYN